jgi:DNA-binding NtrC family response regulator
VAATSVHVLITGPSGSGKGVVGRLLHRWSARAARPFVVVNCAAIPAELAESELFGHRRGAFTGATADQVGKFEAAHGGTLFLDEIGDMGLPAQAKILRAIEDQEIERVGEARPIRVDVRVVAATNQDLDGAVAASRFRLDLLYRLATVRIEVPPLRDRPDDIPLLANCMLAQLASEIPAAGDCTFSPGAIDALLAHPWPGNVRELRNVVASALILRRGQHIEAQDLRLGGRGDGGGDVPATASLEEVERGHIRRALDHHRGNILRTAKALGITRRTLRERIERYRLKQD